MSIFVPNSRVARFAYDWVHNTLTTFCNPRRRQGVRPTPSGHCVVITKYLEQPINKNKEYKHTHSKNPRCQTHPFQESKMSTTTATTNTPAFKPEYHAMARSESAQREQFKYFLNCPRHSYDSEFDEIRTYTKPIRGHRGMVKLGLDNENEAGKVSITRIYVNGVNKRVRPPSTTECLCWIKILLRKSMLIYHTSFV